MNVRQLVVASIAATAPYLLVAAPSPAAGPRSAHSLQILISRWQTLSGGNLFGKMLRPGLPIQYFPLLQYRGRPTPIPVD